MERTRGARRSSSHLERPALSTDSSSSFIPLTPQNNTTASSCGREEPMQIGRTRLTPEERQRRRKEGRCLYCGLLGHFLAACPVKDQAHQQDEGYW